ncbi:MAG: hypothetical protein DRH32_08405 [Deltaproteobacteria bacterium]|nr:MAG: hypothetical protein DRH32_08405 [Deltaproteobacteria bacterium]
MHSRCIRKKFQHFFNRNIQHLEFLLYLYIAIKTVSPTVKPDKEEIAGLIYTSGTTGNPKIAEFFWDIGIPVNRN